MRRTKFDPTWWLLAATVGVVVVSLGIWALARNSAVPVPAALTEDLVATGEILASELGLDVTVELQEAYGQQVPAIVVTGTYNGTADPGDAAIDALRLIGNNRAVLKDYQDGSVSVSGYVRTSTNKLFVEITVSDDMPAAITLVVTPAPSE